MKKIIEMILICVACIFFINCSSEEDLIIDSINLETKDMYDLNTFKISDLKLLIKYTNDKEKEIDVTENMLSKDSLENLYKLGKHYVLINYDDKQVEGYVNLISSDGSFAITIFDGITETQTIYKDKTTIEKPLDPIKEGYEFKNWMVNGEVFDFTTDINNNTLVMAKFERIKLNVKFMVDGEIFDTIEVYWGDYITNIPKPKVSGRVFLGWNMELSNIRIVENLICSAQFDIPGKVCTVKFMIDGEFYTEKEVDYGSYLVDIPQVSKEGFIFDKWDVDFGFVIENDIVTNAIFTKETVYVEYISNEEVVKKIDIDKGQKLENNYILDNTESFEFVGWYIDNKYSEQYDFDLDVKDNLTLYAKWKEAAITIDEAIEYISDENIALLYGDSTSRYENSGWSHYTLNRGNNILFVMNAIEIVDENTILNPKLKNSNYGTLYVNKTGKSFQTAIGNTLATTNGYAVQVIGEKSGKIISVFTTDDPNKNITIPSDGYLWCTKINDSINEQNTNSLKVDMRDIKKTEILSYTDWRDKFEITFVTSFGDEICKTKCNIGEEIVLPEPLEYKNFAFKGFSSYDHLFEDTIITAYYERTIDEMCIIEVIDGSGSGQYMSGTTVNIKALEKENYVFSHWTEFGEKISDQKEITILVNTNTTYKAHYLEKNNVIPLLVEGNKITYSTYDIEATTVDNYIEKNTDFRAIWVSPLAGFSRFTSESQYKASVQEMISIVEKYHYNAVIFHIRTYNDAFYPSELNPKSKYMNTTWDGLKYVIDECHKHGIEFHAWMNPYRIYTNSAPSVENIAKSYANYPLNPASDAKNIIRSSSGGAILNPGLPIVRNFIVRTCMEVIEKYDVDAIHFDDYFYIENINDTETYNQYNPDGLSVDDWRRKQVDLFIEDLSNHIRAYNKENKRFVQLGISPTGIYRNGDGVVSYNSDGDAITTGSNTRGQEHYTDYLYCDTVKWINEEWIDYIMPQVYWAITHEQAPYIEVIEWWNKVVQMKNVKLYSGIGVYMTSYSWSSNLNELKDQITYISQLANVSGSSIFSYGTIKQYYLNNTSALKEEQFSNLFNNCWEYEVLTPEVSSANGILFLDSVTDVQLTLDENKVKITFAPIENARKYVIYRSDGECLYRACDIVEILGTGLDSYEVFDTLEYHSNYTYIICPISGSNTIGAEYVINVQYK